MCCRLCFLLLESRTDPGLPELGWTALVCSRPALSRPQLLIKLSASSFHVWVQSKHRTVRQGALEMFHHLSLSALNQYLSRETMQEVPKVEALKVKLASSLKQCTSVSEKSPTWLYFLIFDRTATPESTAVWIEFLLLAARKRELNGFLKCNRLKNLFEIDKIKKKRISPSYQFVPLYTHPPKTSPTSELWVWKQRKESEDLVRNTIP